MSPVILQWTKSDAAFRYDVLLDTKNPPTRIIESDITTTSCGVANLEPLTTYYWKVVAKGDPFCVPPSSSASEVRSFATMTTCGPPGAFSGQ
jgi:hypothetical protein